MDIFEINSLAGILTCSFDRQTNEKKKQFVAYTCYKVKNNIIVNVVDFVYFLLIVVDCC